MSDYTTSISNFPQKYRALQPSHPIFLIIPTTFQSSVFALSSHSSSHKDRCALCTVLSYAQTALSLPPGKLALSSYIPRSDCGLYCCSLSALISTSNLLDFTLPCPFRKGLLNSGKWLFLLFAIIFRH